MFDNYSDDNLEVIADFISSVLFEDVLFRALPLSSQSLLCHTIANECESAGIWFPRDVFREFDRIMSQPDSLKIYDMLKNEGLVTELRLIDLVDITGKNPSEIRAMCNMEHRRLTAVVPNYISRYVLMRHGME